MKNSLTVIFAIEALSTTAFATQAKKTAKTEKPATAQVETYKLDTSASVIEWKGTKKVGSFHTGEIKVQSGELAVENNVIKSGQVVVDMKTITCKDLTDKEYNAKLVGHLSNSDFFNVDKMPTSTFKLTSAVAGKTKDEVIIKGELTMIGQTQPIEFPATVKFDKGAATGQGTLKIDRTKWGLKYGSGNFFKELAGDKIINDEFELILKLVAKK